MALFGCTCSEAQLHHVGCDCRHFVVTVWPRGYAAADGQRRFYAATNSRLRLESEARRLFGAMACVNYIVEDNGMPTPTVDSATALAYTRGDNS